MKNWKNIKNKKNIYNEGGQLHPTANRDVR